jgi:outer membrane protein insertion porin family
MKPALSQGLSGAARTSEDGTAFAALAGGTIAAIRVEGNQRIEEGTIRSYMLVAPGDPFDPDRLDRSLKTLYATGLFSDVNLRRDGANLVVHVAENPIVNRIVFEGNHKLTDDQLRPVVQLRPRAVFTAALAQADRQKILDEYAKRGRYDARVEPKIIKLDQNRVDVVFEINDGDSTLISRIAFVGNHAFSEGRLKEIINSRQAVWWRFLSTSDSYDADRVNFDKELLRRFYLKNGFVDFQVTSSAAEISPDRKSFFLTYTLDEGERYKIGSVKINSTLRNQPNESFAPLVDIDVGDYYDGDAVERATTAITDAAENRGDPFAEVKARISRNKDQHTVDLVFDVTDGPRIYVDRIDITGNTRTKDKVIRREFRLAEGDAFNASLVRKSRQRLQDLGYFNTVAITTSQGSAPDKVVLNAAVDEKATGELTLGGGYSTDAGALLSAGLHEKNMIGTGIDAGINGVLAQKRSEIDLSVTDPYFLDRNIVTGFDVFHTQNNNQNTAQYSERRTGFALRMGYEFNDHLRQALTYSLVDRSIYNVATTASLIIMDEAGSSILSQVGQTLSLDYRDSRVDPHSGFVIRAGTDFAGVGGDAHFVRAKIDGTYFIPLDTFTGNSDWSIAVSAGAGNLFTLGHQEQIIDRFFLGGDNLRGFQSGGAGPHAVPQNIITGPSAGQQTSADSLGGRLIYTQSTELRFPLPISPDLGLTGRAFVDVGALYETGAPSSTTTSTTTAGKLDFRDSHSPRVGAGVGVSWKTPFGLINLDVADPIIKKKYDQTQVFRFGFGTRF